MGLNKWLCALSIATVAGVFASSASAQTDSSEFEPIRLETIPEVFNRAFFKDSGDFYRNRSLQRQFEVIFGPGVPGQANFPELEIERDAKTINTIYNDVLYQQLYADPLIRTPDLPNPFNTSILVLEREGFRPTRFGNRVEGTEFFFETLPIE
ncbi:MAG: hypothetical protein F6K36_06710 [Symploca sp. SIO3C6]|nr:hypothetical protein [Symploca sp. SIO3C6]NET05531.1 hypothetical protein [Symploca sp. SIO2B6]NET47245.1 hypothetical protein [Merismopedia sp. SIO2A8]